VEGIFGISVDRGTQPGDAGMLMIGADAERVAHLLDQRRLRRRQHRQIDDPVAAGMMVLVDHEAIED
jgi:hypothetical protein